MPKPRTQAERELRTLHSRLGHLSRFQPENTKRQAELLREVGALKLIKNIDNGLASTPITSAERNRILALVEATPVIDGEDMKVGA